MSGMDKDIKDVKNTNVKLTGNKQEVPEEQSDRSKIFSSMVAEDDENVQQLQRWQDVVKALSIDGQWFKRQIGVILLIVAGTILYITNRYQAQQEIIEEESLRAELQDWRFRSLTRSSELTLKSRQSKLEEQLKSFGDSTLMPAATAPYRLIKGH